MSGKYFGEVTPKRSLTMRSLIEYINSHEGVEWMPMVDIAKEFKEGRIAGVEIEGGADG